MKLFLILASIVLLGFVGIQESQATVCYEFDSLFDQNSGHIALKATVLFSDVVILDPPLQTFDGVFSSKLVSEFKIDKQIYGEPIFDLDKVVIEEYFQTEPYEIGEEKILPQFYSNELEQKWWAFDCNPIFDIEYEGYTNWIIELEKESSFEFDFDKHSFENYLKTTNGIKLESYEEVNWNEFIIKATELHIKSNFDNYFIFPETLKIVPIVSGKQSLPPPMLVYLYFKYDVAKGIDTFKARYDVNALGLLENEIIISEASPKKQNDMLVWYYWVDCQGDLVKVIKSSDNSFACVTENTKQKLLERGWAVEFSSKYPPKEGCLAFNKEWNGEFRYCYAIDNDLCADLGGNQTCAVDGSPGKSGLEDICIRVCEFR